MNLIFLLKNLDEKQIGELLSKYYEYLVEKSFVGNIFRTIGYTILKLLYHIAKMSYEFFDSIAGLNLFFKFSQINNIYDKILLLTGSITTIYIIIVSLKSIIDMKLNKDIIKNAIISAVLIAMLPFIMTKGAELVTASITYIKDFNSSDIKQELKNSNHLADVAGELTQTEESIVDNVYRNIFIDVRENIIDKDFDSEKIKEIKGNSVPVNKLNRLKINEMMLDENDNPIHEVLQYRLIDENIGVQKITDNGWLVPSFKIEGYYRWKFNFIYGVSYLILLLFVFLKSSFTIAKLIFELGLNKIVAPLILATDVESGERRKTVIREIGIAYATIVATYISIHIYSVFLNWINSLSNTNVFLKILLIAGATTGVLKGSSLVEKSFGIQTNSSGRGLLGGLRDSVFFANQTKSLFSSKRSNSTNEQNDNTNKDNKTTNSLNEEFGNKRDNSNQDLNGFRNGNNNGSKNNNYTDKSNSLDNQNNQNNFSNGSGSGDLNGFRNGNNAESKSDVWNELKSNNGNDSKNDYFKDKGLDSSSNKKDIWEDLRNNKK